MVTSFDHIHIYSSDPEASLSFYERNLGAERVGEIPASGGRTNRFLILGGQYIAVSEFPAGMEPADAPSVGDGAVKNGFGVAHFGLNVDDLDRVIARLVSDGVDVHSDANDAGPLRFVYFTAPDGIVIELTQYVLPAKLRPVAAGLRAFNRGVHFTKRAIAKKLLSSVASATKTS
jgi:catechol 2,3-dioxygenase-like lactoylglutathione lyase family enzyme